MAFNSGAAAGGAGFNFTYIADAGFNGWAEANGIVVLYPQKDDRVETCWDGYGWQGEDYATKSGVQMAAVWEMVRHVARLKTDEHLSGDGYGIPALSPVAYKPLVTDKTAGAADLAATLPPPSTTSRDLDVRERECALRERELAVRERELALREVAAGESVILAEIDSNVTARLVCEFFGMTVSDSQ